MPRLRSPKPDPRRALELLASCRYGRTEANKQRDKQSSPAANPWKQTGRYFGVAWRRDLNARRLIRSS
jgi:hypothetical protein